MSHPRHIQREQIERIHGAEIIRLHVEERFGFKAIGARLGISGKTCRTILIRRGVYSPQNSIRMFCRPEQIEDREHKLEKDKELQWMSAAWRNEWRGVVDEYWSAYARIRRNRKRATDRANARYASLSADQRRDRNAHLIRNRDKAAHAERCRRWRISNLEHRRAWARKYMPLHRQRNPSFRVASAVRGRIREALKGNYSAKTNASQFYVGCSWADLRTHIQSQFKRGMHWNNYGPVWHIDHIVPCAYFDLTREDELRRCFHFSNLRPLWAKENMSRGCNAGSIQGGLGI